MPMENHERSLSHARDATTPGMSRKPDSTSGERDGNLPHSHFHCGGSEDCSKNIATIFDERKIQKSLDSFNG